MIYKNLYLIIFICLFFNQRSYSQGSIEDYKRAEAIDTLFKKKVYNSPTEFFWLNGSQFWYINNSKTGSEYILVNAVKGTKEVLFDHRLMAINLSEILHNKVAQSDIDLSKFKFDSEKEVLEFQNDTLSFEMNLKTKKVLVTDTIKRERIDRNYWGNRNAERKREPVLSPDGTHKAYVKNSNLYVENLNSGQEFQLSYDGSEGFFYSPNIKWSPDSNKLMAYKVRPGKEHKIYFVESSPADQLQPKLQSRDYLKPGDVLDFNSPQLFHLKDKKHISIPTNLFQSQFGLDNYNWEGDSSAFTFEFNQRGHQVYRVIRVNAENGNVKTIIDETSPTFIDYSGKKFRHDVEVENEIIWASERDGYNHLYLYDSKTGEVKNQITTGEWPVREVVEVDDENRHVYFTASGLDNDQDPYLIHYFRIDFDGKNLIRFTSENGNHEVTFSPDHKYYIDKYSRVDLPPVTMLKKTVSNKKVMDLEKADITALKETGWQMPEVFVSKGRDEKTDIWGIIVRPTNFDPSRFYPIIEYIYAGPHDSFVPKEFHSHYWAMNSLAELGFIVVQIDGMGTSNRSKEFHNVCWQNLKDAGFPDRKLWIKAAAEKYPYMDAERVGIRGTSAGGQSAGGALVFNSDFYDVAVASCGCHDNRMDKIWWNEQWMGYPVGPHYAESSNIVNAEQLQGDLMLIVGEVDDNVDPASTMQFADALIKAGKDFELVVLPGAGHTSGGEYGERKRRDFFVKHLLKVDPPSWDKVYEN